MFEIIPTITRININLLSIEWHDGKKDYINRGSVLSAIEAIKENKEHYATEEAYKSDLSFYENCLQILNSGD